LNEAASIRMLSMTTEDLPGSTTPRMILKLKLKNADIPKLSRKLSKAKDKQANKYGFNSFFDSFGKRSILFSTKTDQD